MPREVMRFNGANGVTFYRLVDQRPATGSEPNGVIERLRSFDAMGGETWERVFVSEEPQVVWDLLNALADVAITRVSDGTDAQPVSAERPVVFAVRRAPTDTATDWPPSWARP